MFSTFIKFEQQREIIINKKRATLNLDLHFDSPKYKLSLSFLFGLDQLVFP
jgi:hypothetical protein